MWKILVHLHRAVSTLFGRPPARGTGYCPSVSNTELMSILAVHWDLVMPWQRLTLPAKLYILCLLVAGLYAVYLLARTILGLRHLPESVAATETSARRLRLLEMIHRTENLRDLITLLFFSFGISFANEMFATLRAIRNSSMSLAEAHMDIFEPLTAFAFVVFVALAVLHAVRWTITALLRAKLAGMRLFEE